MPGKTPVIGANRMSTLGSSRISSSTLRFSGRAVITPPESSGLARSRYHGTCSASASIVGWVKRGTGTPWTPQRSATCDAVPPDIAYTPTPPFPPTRRGVAEHPRDLDHLVEVVDPDHAVLLEDRVVHRIGAREVAGVGVGHLRPFVAPADLDRDDRHAPLRSEVGREHEGPPALETFDVRGDGAHLVEAD